MSVQTVTSPAQSTKSASTFQRVTPASAQTDDTERAAQKVGCSYTMYRHTQTSLYTQTYTHIHTHIHTYIHTYIHTFIHTYLPTYLPTYIHTYIHT